MHRLPSIHFNPNPMSFFGFEASFHHNALEFMRVLPLLQLHGSQAIPDPCIQVPKYLLEFLNPEIGNPSLKIFVEFPDVFGHGQRVVSPGQSSDFILEFGPCLVAHTDLSP